MGDALGAPVEFDSLARIQERFGPPGLTDLHEAYGVLGAATDDTQMTLFTAEGLVRGHLRVVSRGVGSAPLIVGHAYARWLHTQGRSSRIWRDAPDGWLVVVPEMRHVRAPGNTCLTALEAGREGSIDGPLNDSKGCGAVMRIAPVGIYPALSTDSVFNVACEVGALTHGHPTGYLAAGALADILKSVVREQSGLDEALSRTERLLDRLPGDGAGETVRGIRRARELAFLGNGVEASPAAVESLGAGWVAEEALSIGVYCALVAHDFSHGVLLAANHSGNGDSTASITGTLLGANSGVDAIPGDWIEQLELRAPVRRICDDYDWIAADTNAIVAEDWIDESWAVACPPN